MSKLARRRFLLKAAAGGVAAACLPWSRGVIDPARAQPSGDGGGTQPAGGDGGAAQGIERAALGDGLVLLTGAGANVVALLDADGTVMVDGGLAERSPALLRTLETEASGAPVRVLFNTHWHPEQTGSNDALGKQGTRIIAHENTRLWLGTEIVRPAEGFTHTALPEHARPNESFYSDGELVLGGERIAYRHLPQAHTDGDLYVRFPTANVLAVGDLVAVNRYPVLDYVTGGFLPGLAQATQALLEVADENTRIVPAQGPVRNRAHLEAQLEMLTTVLERMIDRLYRGFSAHDMLEDGVTEGFDEAWGDPEPFVVSAYKGMWGHVREFEGIV